MTWALQELAFQRKMTTTEYRHHLGRYVDALEKKKKIPSGLLATAYRYDVPGFCASPGDGSTFLNAMKLWTMQERLGVTFKQPFRLEIDLQKDVYEACAMHYWAQKKEGNKKLAYLVCGGGAAKNYLLQPEPALGKSFLFLPRNIILACR